MGLDAVEMVMEIEDEFGISLSDERMSRVVTVADMFESVLDEIPQSTKVEAVGSCRKCGYLLRGLRNPECPECGAPFFLDKAYKNHDLVWELMVGIICETIGCRPDEVRPESRFVEDLRMG